ncbi:MAG: class I SAM-dependent methyltransferase [Treponema sp.]|nr:class I SAM-dependent methyltransferase [Treponema sp.]
MNHPNPRSLELEQKNSEQAEMLYNRLVKRYRHLKKWARRIGTDTFRLYDRDIPEIPLVLDLYGDAVSGALYKRPYEKDEADEELWLQTMKGSVSKALDIPEERIFLKTRQRQKGNSQYNRFGSGHFWKDVSEGDLKFRVNLSDYLDTGLFPDSRKKRAMLRSQAAGKRFLNLFSYTCTLSVCAAAGGAAAIDSVDMSKTYLDWGAVNFSLNKIKTATVDAWDFLRKENSGNSCNLIRADVLKFLRDAASAKKTWDLIMLDPPSFSNSKKMEGDLDICRDYAGLISQCLEILAPGGNLWFSTNARNFRFETEEFPDCQIQLMDLEDEDFKGKRIPACWSITGRTAV